MTEDVYFNGGEWRQIDNRTPDSILMEREDGEDVYQPSGTDEDAKMLARCEPGILMALLRFLIPATEGGKKLRIAQLRLICLAHHAGLEGIGDQSITQLASQLGITKAALSHWNIKIADELGQFQTRQGKSPEARRTYSATARAHHQRMGHRVKPLQDGL